MAQNKGFAESINFDTRLNDQEILKYMNHKARSETIYKALVKLDEPLELTENSRSDDIHTDCYPCKHNILSEEPVGLGE